MKQTLYLLLVTLLAMACQEQAITTDQNAEKEPAPVNKTIDPLWQKAEFDSAVGVILNGDHKLYFKLKAMDTSYAPETRRLLSTGQLKNLSAQLSGQVEVELEPNECFQPYHGIFFYKEGQVTGRLAACFVCNTFYTQPGKSSNVKLRMMKKMFQDWGLPTYNWNNEAETASSTIKYGDYFQ